MATTTERGYGNDHRKTRKAWTPIVNAGRAVCSRCGRGIVPGTYWDLDHTPDRSGYLGPAHRSCNRAAGARTANKRRAAVRSVVRLMTSRTW